MNDILGFARNMLSQGQVPNANAPWANQAIQAIMSGDQAAGERIANNILQSYGVSKEQALRQACDYFNIRR